MVQTKKTKTVRSRIWTSVLDLEAEHVKFPDKAYEKYNGNVEKFNEVVLGAHYADHKGTQVMMIDPAKYMKYISGIIHKYDDRAMVYGMIHDQDIQYDKLGDPIYKHGQRVLDLAPTHFHLLIHFSKAVTIQPVSVMTGIIRSELEKGKTRGRYAFSSAMAYLIHALEPKKHQYDPEDVLNGEFNDTVSNENGLYMDYYKGHREEWESRRVTVQKQRRNLDFDRIYEDVMLGKYSREDLIGGPDDLYKLYVEHKDKLDQARSAYLDRRFIQYNRGVDNGTIKIQTLFIFGKAGHGKTRLAKAVSAGLAGLSHGEWRIFQTGSEHPFDEYDGEEIILLDDIRANALNASDWLHLIDPHNNGVTSARYHDAKPMPRLLIITTTTPAHEFFAYTRGLGADEPLDQFLRRIQWSANAIDVNRINLGHTKKLDYSKRLKLDDKVTSKTVSDRYGETKHYKMGNEKTYGYAFEDWVTGSFDDVKSSLVKFYGTYFGLINARDNLGLIAEHKATNSALPVVSDGEKWALNDRVAFESMFDTGNE